MTTTPPGGTPTSRSERVARYAPLLLGAVAALLSVVALVVALGAYSRVSDDSSSTVRPATEVTSTGTPAPTVATPEATGPTDPAAGGPTGTGVPLPSDGAPYVLVQQNVRVTLAGGYGARRTLDLDQPRVNADAERADVALSTAYGPPVLQFRTADVAAARSPAVTPDECAANLRLAPSDTQVQLRPNLVLCAVTDGAGAVDEPPRPKLARLVVGAVAADGTTALTITTWEIPR